MATSKPVSLQVSDLIEWFRRKELVVNETFQRHSVWTPSAKTYLIDSVLNELPLPKIYLRSIIDSKAQRTIREIVDGQQRIRTLVAFASNELRLSKRSVNFNTKKYEDLTPEDQAKFLGYTVTAELLLNATDDDVIDIFARLNSYTVSLNAAEKRHANFQTEFKFTVRKAAQRHRNFIEKYDVFTTKQRFRMADDAFMAEAYGILLEGVRDGGETNLKKLYERQDDDVFTESVSQKATRKLTTGLAFLDTRLSQALRGEFSKPYQLLMLFAAFVHARFGLEAGDLQYLPERKAVVDPEVVIGRLAELERALQVDEPPRNLKAFFDASKSSTQRVASRRVRFYKFYNALTGAD